MIRKDFEWIISLTEGQRPFNSSKFVVILSLEIRFKKPSMRLSSGIK